MKGARLWDKGEEVNADMHRLTVGNDHILDSRMIKWDCIGSAAHVRMLKRIGLLESDAAQKILTELAAISNDDSFSIPLELEDVHTAIECRLTEKLGDIGERVHTGRSRNDQVLLMMRLYTRAELLSSLESLCGFIDLLYDRYQEHKDVPLPGYTHFQPAMPSSLGMWLHGWIEWSLDLLSTGLDLFTQLNTNPLGAAAGFGVPLPLDRYHVADILGFDRVQRSVIDVQNSRGRYELRVLNWGSEVAQQFEKLAWECLLYSTREFAYFKFPKSLTTGSSIMPQKRNLDLAELLRGKASRVRSAAFELSQVSSGLPVSYHRDLQYTKEPAMRGYEELSHMFSMACLLISGFEPDIEKIKASMHDEMYATFDAVRLVKDGKTFRSAYRETAEKVEKGELDIASLKDDFTFISSASDSSVSESKKGFTTLKTELEFLINAVSRKEKAVFNALV